MSAGRTAYAEPDGTSKSLDECAADFEAGLIRRTLEQCGGNRSRNARLFGLRANTLHYKLVRHGLAGNRRKLDD
ncbi:MAG: helix-turn-helix domain-containing protein [Acidiferrobacteraceae bacterium]|jgi:DNA-binding NtrC family response regulator